MGKPPLPESVDPQMILYDVILDNGKYRIIYHADAKRPQAFRHGEPWPAFADQILGSNAVMAMACRIVELEEEVINLQNEIGALRDEK